MDEWLAAGVLLQHLSCSVLTGSFDAQSDEQARAGAEAGSRLLEYITRGANGAGVEEPKSRLPLFQRMNGGHAAHQSVSPLSHDGHSPSRLPACPPSSLLRFGPCW